MAKLNTLFWVLGIGLLAIGLLSVWGIFIREQNVPAQVVLTQPNGNGVSPVVTTGCPTDGDTNLKIDVKNSLNESGSEGFDVTGYLYKISGDKEEYVGSITDTTSPSATTIDCGYKYVFKPVSTDGASGDSSHFDSVISGDADTKIEDGWLYFTADSSNENIIVGMPQHATLKCRAYDNIQRALMYDNGDSSATDYETDGVTWTSTTDNATASDETLGLDIEFQCKSVQTDTNYNDRGVLVLIEAPSNTWAVPSVYANGQKLTDIKSTGLNSDEVKAYADYEYAFLIPASMVWKDAGDGIDVRVVMDLVGGVSSASADPQVDFAVRGSKLSIDGVNVITGGVGDDSSKTTVYSVYDMTIDVT